MARFQAVRFDIVEIIQKADDRRSVSQCRLGVAVLAS